jgi:alpha-beta hydrolase superfamily lysophospholipase
VQLPALAVYLAALSCYRVCHVVLQYPGEPWYVIGHSMGAAMATLCALDLRFRLQPVPDVSMIVLVLPSCCCSVQSKLLSASLHVPNVYLMSNA